MQTQPNNTDLKQWYASSVLTVLLALLLRVKVLPL